MNAEGWNRAETIQPALRWPSARLAAVQTLWGDGYTTPGGDAETLRLVKPLALSSSMTLLLLGGGLGGPAQAISAAFGAWVAEFEADEEQRALATMTAAAGDQRISVGAWNPAAPAFRPRSANHALLREVLRGRPPGPLLESVANALSANCQIVLTELVADTRPSPTDRDFAAWCRLEHRLPDVPQAAAVTSAFEGLRFDVRVTEDVSERHVAQTLGGWRDSVRAMAAGPRPTPHNAAAFVTEAELWLLRIRLMRRLGVRLDTVACDQGGPGLMVRC